MQSSLLASGSYYDYIIICCRVENHWCMHVFVEREPNHQSSWQANNVIYPKQTIFAHYIIQVFKSLQGKCPMMPHFKHTNQVIHIIPINAVTDRHTNQIHAVHVLRDKYTHLYTICDRICERDLLTNFKN